MVAQRPRQHCSTPSLQQRAGPPGSDQESLLFPSGKSTVSPWTAASCPSVLPGQGQRGWDRGSPCCSSASRRDLGV